MSTDPLHSQRKVKVVHRSGRRYYVFRWQDCDGRWREQSSGIEVKRGNRRKAEAAAESLAIDTADWVEFRRRYDAEVLQLSSDGYLRTTNRALALAEEQGLARLEQFTSSFVSQYVAKLRERPISKATVASYVRHLVAAQRWAFRMGLCSHRVTTERGVTTHAKPRGMAPTADEFGRWLRAARSQRPADWRRWVWILRALRASGLRLGESGRITLSESPFWLDLSAGVLRIYEQKAKREDVIPITKDFARLVERLGRTDGKLFPYQETTDHAGKVIRAIAKKAGLPHTAHDLRRAFGVQWAEVLMPADLQKLMRHANIETTMRYYVTKATSGLAERLREQG